jgi:hypothetical protein
MVYLVRIVVTDGQLLIPLILVSRHVFQTKGEARHFSLKLSRQLHRAFPEAEIESTIVETEVR